LSLQDLPGIWGMESTTGLAGIAGEVTRQATTIGFMNAANLFLWTSLVVYPLIALVVWPPRGYRPRG
jgi:type IV secretory pathway VirB3-like protein